MCQNFHHFPKLRGENQEYVSCHHLVLYSFEKNPIFAEQIDRFKQLTIFGIWSVKRDSFTKVKRGPQGDPSGPTVGVFCRGSGGEIQRSKKIRLLKFLSLKKKQPTTL